MWTGPAGSGCPSARCPRRLAGRGGPWPMLRSGSTTPRGRAPNPTVGLPPLRRAWITDRDDVERVPGPLGTRRRRRPGSRRRTDPRPSLSRPGPAARCGRPGRAGDPAALRPAGRDHPRDEFVALREGVDRRGRPRRGGRGPGDHPGQRQPSRVRADGHRHATSW